VHPAGKPANTQVLSDLWGMLADYYGVSQETRPVKQKPKIAGAAAVVRNLHGAMMKTN